MRGDLVNLLNWPTVDEINVIRRRHEEEAEANAAAVEGFGEDQLERKRPERILPLIAHHAALSAHWSSATAYWDSVTALCALNLNWYEDLLVLPRLLTPVLLALILWRVW